MIDIDQLAAAGDRPTLIHQQDPDGLGRAVLDLIESFGDERPPFKPGKSLGDKRYVVIVDKYGDLACVQEPRAGETAEQAKARAQAWCESINAAYLAASRIHPDHPAAR